MPTFEDKLLQRAVTMVLEAVHEQDFLSCSHGYRPGRSAHTALCELRQELMEMGGGWVLEVDIKAFFDSLSHSQLRTILDQRVRDGVLRRTIEEQPTMPQVLWGASPLPSIARFGRQAYPMRVEVTTRVLLGCKSHGCLPRWKAAAERWERPGWRADSRA